MRSRVGGSPLCRESEPIPDVTRPSGDSPRLLAAPDRLRGHDDGWRRIWEARLTHDSRRFFGFQGE